MNTAITAIIEENKRRHERIQAMRYDPETGNPASDRRVPVDREGLRLYLPVSMVEDPGYSPTMGRPDFERLRFRHDFEYWAARCVSIIDKVTAETVPLRLNAPQRRFVDAVERERNAGKPLRFIMLKARQWGGSTVVQVYFAWIQIIHRRNWNSLICAHVKDTAATIRGMYTRLLDSYP